MTITAKSFRISYGAAQRQDLGEYPDKRVPACVARVRERDGEDAFRTRAAQCRLELGPIVRGDGFLRAYGYSIETLFERATKTCAGCGETQDNVADLHPTDGGALCRACLKETL